MLFGPFWLLWHRLWLVLLGYLVVVAALGATLSLLGASGNVRVLVFLLLAMLMGLEAATLSRWSYSWGKWRLIDFVVADDEEAAERRFFDRWTEDPRRCARRHPTTCRRLLQPRSMPRRRRASSACFQNLEDRDDGRDHRLRLGQSAFGGEGV